MSDLDDYALFVTILEAGSISAAARQRRQSVQSASRALARLEDEIGTQLVQRTTRALTPTPAGIAFFERIRRPVLELELARTQARDEGQDVAGTVRIGAPVYFGAACIAPAVARFARRWPALRTEMVMSDRISNLLDDRLDLAIRIGELPDSGLQARRLTALRRVFFAAPAFLEQHGNITDPMQLADLPCVARTIGPERDRWPVVLDGQERRIKVNVVFCANDAAACNEAVACGVGVGIAPYWQVRPLLEAGRVQLVLAECEPSPIPVHAVWNATTSLPLRVRLLIDQLAASFAGAGW